jgi:hypothetical protein
MKFAIAVALVTAWGGSARAQVDIVPPKSIWDTDLDGTMLHRQSGFQCDTAHGDFRRNPHPFAYDKIGLDVSCGYADPRTGDTITVYLTRRDPSLQQKVFDGAKAAVVQLNPTAKPRDGALPAPASALTWLRAGFTEKNGAMASDLFLTSLSGWDYEIRATYRPDDSQAVSAEIANIDAMLMKSAGTHLAACAAVPAPVRDGALMQTKEMMLVLTLSGIAEASVNISKDAPSAVWCAETGFSVGEAHFLDWRNAASNALVTERMTGPDGTPTLYVLKDLAAAEIARKKDPASVLAGKGGYDVVADTPDSIRLLDIYAGYPPLTLAAGPLAGKHGVLATAGKTDKKITINANAVSPP